VIVYVKDNQCRSDFDRLSNAIDNNEANKASVKPYDVYNYQNGKK